MNGIIYNGPLAEPSGFGTCSRDYVKCLHKYGLNINTNVIKYYSGCSKDLIDNDDLKLMESLQKTFSKEECKNKVFVNHCTPYESYQSIIMPYLSNCKKCVMYSVWETDKIPEMFKQFFNYYDLVLTASEFSKQAFKKTIPELPIEVVPHIITNYDNVNIAYHPSIKKLKDEGKIIFFANLEWHIGKGYDVLIPGFINAFKDRDDVVLVLKTYNLSQRGYKDSIIEYLKKIKGDRNFPKIIPFIGDVYWKDLLSLYKTADCYISMSRREAFGLTMSEAFGFGLPIICPDKGGQVQFLNKDNSIMINSKWKEVNGLESERSLYVNQRWIEPDYDDYVYKLKYFYKNKDNLKDLLLIERNKTINDFSDKEICRQLTKHLIG